MADETELSLLRHELGLLNERSIDMNSKLGSLSGALESVAQLQADQRMIEATARTASTRVEEVAARSATKDELNELNRQRRRAVRNLYIAIGSGTIAVLMVGIGGIAAATAYNDSQNRFLRTQFDNCTVRNQATVAGRQLVDDLIRAEQHSVDPNTAGQLIATLKQAEGSQVLVDCSNLLKD